MICPGSHHLMDRDERSLCRSPRGLVIRPYDLSVGEARYTGDGRNRSYCHSQDSLSPAFS